MRYEFAVAARYLGSRRKGAFVSLTTAFTAGGVGLGVAALVVMLSVMNGFEANLRQRVLALTPQVQVHRVGGTISDFRKLQQRIDRLPEVEGSDPFIVGEVLITSHRSVQGAAVRGVEPLNPVVVAELDRYVRAGRLATLAADDRAVGLGLSLANRLGVTVGEEVRLVAPVIGTQGGRLFARSGHFRVGLVVESGVESLDASLAFLGLDAAGRFFGRGGAVDGIDIRLKNLDATARVVARLARLLPGGFRVSSWMEFDQAAAAGFAMLQRVYAIVLLLLVALAAFNLVATLIMVMMHRRRDVAVLMAMGARPGEIGRIFVAEGLLVGLAGTALGVVAGAIGCWALARYRFVHIPREIYGIAALPVEARYANFLLVGAASLLLCALATLYPARQVARMHPAEVLRS